MSERKRLQEQAIISHYRNIVRERRLSEECDIIEAKENLRVYDASPVLDIDTVPDGRRRVLIEILWFYTVNKHAPKTREIMRQLKLSAATVGGYIGELRDDEWLRSDISARGGLAIYPTPQAIKVYESEITRMKPSRII